MTHIRIFDTTLRDGEQAPGFSMTPESKLRMAKALAALRVDVIEAGFAASSLRRRMRNRSMEIAATIGRTDPSCSPRALPLVPIFIASCHVRLLPAQRKPHVISSSATSTASSAKPKVATWTVSKRCWKRSARRLRPPCSRLFTTTSNFPPKTQSRTRSPRLSGPGSFVAAIGGYRNNCSMFPTRSSIQRPRRFRRPVPVPGRDGGIGTEDVIFLTTSLPRRSGHGRCKLAWPPFAAERARSNVQ